MPTGKKTPTAAPPEAPARDEDALIAAVVSAARRVVRFPKPRFSVRHVDQEDVDRLERAINDMDGIEAVDPDVVELQRLEEQRRNETLAASIGGTNDA